MEVLYSHTSTPPHLHVICCCRNTSQQMHSIYKCLSSVTIFGHSIFSSTGDRLAINVISSHDVASSIDCGQQCLQQATCVAFNYRSTRKSNEPNCQLSNNTEGFEENGDNVGDWIFRKALYAVLIEIKNNATYKLSSIHVLLINSNSMFVHFQSPCSKNPCKNGAECIQNVCQQESFSCKCGVKYKGKLCEVEKGMIENKLILFIFLSNVLFLFFNSFQIVSGSV